MKIIGLQSENVKRLKLVELRFDPKNPVVFIRGNNGNGKTSLIDSVQYALGGKDAAPPEVVRKGEEKAQVVVDLDDLVVKRHWTKGGTYLEVRSKAGAKMPSPQAMLDKLTNGIAFDPLAFLRLDAKKQGETFEKLVGLNLGEVEARRRKAFEERTFVNREAKTLEGRIGGLPPAPKSEPAESIDTLLDEQTLLLDQDKENEAVRSRLATAVADEKNAANELRQAEQRLAEAKAALERATQRQSNAFQVVLEANDAARALSDVAPELASVRERIKKAQAGAAEAQKAAERTRLEAELAARLKQSAELTAAIDGAEAEKQQRLAACKFPVDGLGLDDRGLTLNGLPVVQASGAEQLRLAVAMGLALNPELKVLLIRDGSLLDQNSVELLTKMASEANAQVFVEMVGTEGPGIIIEDGEVLEEKAA